MGDADTEDTKSLDSNDGAVLTGEENHSSNSDMVHLEREEAEMLEEAEEKRKDEEEEEDEELQTSVLSMLGVDTELLEQDLQAPETEGLLVSVEEPHMEREPVEFRHVVPPMALPPLPIVKLDPPSTTSTPVPSTTTSEVEELYSSLGLHPPSILAPGTAEHPEKSVEEQKFSQISLSDVEETIKETPPEQDAPKTKPLSSTELLFGGAAFVAVVAVVAYSAVVYCKK